MPRSVNPAPIEWMALFLSYFHFLATLTATLLCVELAISGSVLTHDTGFMSRAMLPIGLLGAINIPVQFWIRSFGVRKFRFREHEAHLDATHLLPAESRPHRAGTDIFSEMNALIQAIDAADVWERQTARNAAKEWIVTNRSRLDAVTRAYLRERVGYLLPE